MLPLSRGYLSFPRRPQELAQMHRPHPHAPLLHPKSSPGSRYRILAGLLLGLAMLKFGNPVIFDEKVAQPHGLVQWLVQPWPVSWAYLLLAPLVATAEIPETRELACREVVPLAVRALEHGDADRHALVAGILSSLGEGARSRERRR